MSAVSHSTVQHEDQRRIKKNCILVNLFTYHIIYTFVPSAKHPLTCLRSNKEQQQQNKSKKSGKISNNRLSFKIAAFYKTSYTGTLKQKKKKKSNKIILQIRKCNFYSNIKLSSSRRRRNEMKKSVQSPSRASSRNTYLLYHTLNFKFVFTVHNKARNIT